MIYGGHFDFDTKKSRICELEKEVNDPNFWSNKENSNNNSSEE